MLFGRIAVASVGLVALMASDAYAQATAYAGDDFNKTTSGEWTCWEANIPNGASSIEQTISGGTGDVDLKVFVGSVYPAGWNSTNTPICYPYLGGNNESCSTQVQNAYNASPYPRVFTICTLAYSVPTGNVGVNLGYTTATGTIVSQGSGSATTYYATCWKDQLFWFAYHRGCCLVDYTGGTGLVRSSLDYDGFSDNDYCRLNEHWSNGPASHEAENVDAEYKNLGTNFTTAKSTMDSCGQWTNLMHGHNNTVGDPSYKTAYKRRPSGCSYNILTDCNSDCWYQDFAGCLGAPYSIAAIGCQDE
jgi:hypothetical protein